MGSRGLIYARVPLRDARVSILCILLAGNLPSKLLLLDLLVFV